MSRRRQVLEVFALGLARGNELSIGNQDAVAVIRAFNHREDRPRVASARH
jgi:hypothetical protein